MLFLATKTIRSCVIGFIELTLLVERGLYIHRTRQIFKNICMLFLFQVTINVLFSCLVVVLRTRKSNGRVLDPVLGRLHGPYTYTACTRIYDCGYTAVYMARTRPCTWRCTGRVRAVYTAVLLHGREYGRVHSPYTAVYGPRVEVYTARIHGIALSMAFDRRCIRF